MKYGRSLQELAIELDRQAKVKKDYVATAGAMQMTAVNENFDLVIGNTPFQLNENAHRQLGLQLKIPAPYYERMRAENPGLLMANVNGWFQQSPDTRRMVRTLDGTARAILSDRYRRIDNYEVAQTVLPIISEMQGARIESCELTDTRMYIKVVNERIQTEVVPGDIVQAGILISNSEVGMGSVSVKPLIYRLVCTNGMVADVGVGKRHVGRINESVDGDFGIFRDETIEADDRAFLMKIEDTVRAAVDEARFNALVQKLRDAKEAPILPAAAPKVVELAAKEFNIRQNESEGILGHLIAGGDLSLYGLANAVTRHAQDVQSYDRSTELEATGYKIITMQPSLLKRWQWAVIEMVASYGMAVGREVFDTVLWIGRFYEALSIQMAQKPRLLCRIEEKRHICHDSRANDPAIRRALIDRFATHDLKNGKGTSKNPDFFYGFKADIWAAYAVGLTAIENHNNDYKISSDC